MITNDYGVSGRPLYKNLVDALILARPLAFIGVFILFILNVLMSIKIQLRLNYDWISILSGALACSFLASAAYVLNNIYDIEIDKINKPSRPLPSHRISVKRAWWVTVTLYSLSNVLAIRQSKDFFILFILMAILTIVYSCPPFRLKRYGHWANVTVALARGLLLVLASWAVTGGIRHFFPWFLGMISTLFLIGATPTKDIADIPGDQRHRCLSLPVKFGICETASKIRPFLILPFLCIPFGVYWRILPLHSLPLTLLAFYGLFITITIRTRPESKVVIEGNHVSWAHSYALYLLLHGGMYLCLIV